MPPIRLQIWNPRPVHRGDDETAGHATRMRILVTGGTGFIGRHLVRALLEGGHQVDVLSRAASRQAAEGSPPGGARAIVGDLVTDDLGRLLPNDLEVVYHLAAMGSVGECIAQPHPCFQVNALGTQKVLEAARNRHVRRLILASSVYVYGDVQRFPTPEDIGLSPNNLLGASKAAAEHLARAYAISYDLPVTVFRPFTVYGPGSKPHQLIPSLIEEIFHAPFVSVGDPDATRDFVHVHDVVKGLLRGLQDTQPFSVFNLGTGVETSIAGLVELLLSMTQTPEKEVRVWQQAPRVDERGRRSRQCAEISRASSCLSWRPTVSLRDGLSALIAQIRKTDASPHGIARSAARAGSESHV